MAVRQLIARSRLLVVTSKLEAEPTSSPRHWSLTFLWFRHASPARSDCWETTIEAT